MTRTRLTRLTALTAGFGIGASLMLSAATPAHALPVEDINGDGSVDYAIGYPLYGGGAGAVQVSYGLNQPTVQITPDMVGLPHQPTRGFGWSTLVRDLNGDGFSDLVIGSPGSPPAPGAESPGLPGVVTVLYGSSTGLDLSHPTHRSMDENQDRFGWSLAALGGGTTTALVVGAPWLQQDDLHYGGGVVVYPITNGKLGIPEIITQDTYRVPGASEDNDQFGYAIDADGNTLVVGAPTETLGTRTQAGMVTLLNFNSSAQLTSAHAFNQDTTGIPETVSTNDWFGSAVAAHGSWFAASAPGENIGTVANTGLVQPFKYVAGGPVTAKPYIHQNGTGVPGGNERNDYFGDTLAIVRPTSSVLAVAIGTPYEDLGSSVDAGMVTLVRFDGAPWASRTLAQEPDNNGSIPGTRNSFEWTGIGLTRLVDPTTGLHDLAVTTANDDGPLPTVAVVPPQYTSTDEFLVWQELTSSATARVTSASTSRIQRNTEPKPSR